MEDDMDIDAVMAEFDVPSSAKSTSSKPPCFRPKPRGTATAATATTKTTIKAKIYPITNPPVPTPSSLKINPKPEPDAPWSIGGGVAELEADAEEEDEVVREIDVFLTPSPLDEDGTKIYVLQYPLRPNWQSYELEKRCTEVRMIPNSRKMEVDFLIDDDHQTYDADVARPLGIDKQTLRSLVAPSATDYAVGILRKNQIHLNPIDGVVQLRPVLKSDQQKYTTQLTDTEKKAKKVDSTQTEEEDESWVSLEFLPESSILSDEYQKKMVTTEHTEIEFRMTESDYMGALCPGESINRRETKEAIIRELLKLPLEERLKKWFTEVSQVNRFDFVERILARAKPEQEVLKQVQKLADLVRGIWVTKTSLLYEGYEAAVRDCILLQFTKGDSIPCQKLRDNLGRNVLANELLKPLLMNLIISKPKENKVKFKGSLDPTFRKRYSSVVREQEQAWAAREESILEMARKFNMNSDLGCKRARVSKEDKEKKIAENGVAHGDGRPAMSANKSVSVPETNLFLCLKQICLRHLPKYSTSKKIKSVVRDLRVLAKRLSPLAKDSDKNKHLIDGALYGASAGQINLQNSIKKVAVDVNGVYVRKPPVKQHLSNLFILLFIEAKNAKAVLRKQEIMQRGKEIFKREISESEYAQVVDEICITTEDGWVMLRTGD